MMYHVDLDIQNDLDSMHVFCRICHMVILEMSTAMCEIFKTTDEQIIGAVILEHMANCRNKQLT